MKRVLVTLNSDSKHLPYESIEPYKGNNNYDIDFCFVL